MILKKLKSIISHCICYMISDNMICILTGQL